MTKAGMWIQGQIRGIDHDGAGLNSLPAAKDGDLVLLLGEYHSEAL